MKIVYVIQRYKPGHLTGSEKVIDVLATTVAGEKGYKATVITSDTELVRGFYQPSVKRLPNKEAMDGVTVRRLQYNWFVGSSSTVLNAFFPFLNKLTGGRLAFEGFGPHLINLEKTILEEKPDVIHTGPMPLFHVLVSWQIAKKHNIPFIVTPMMHFDVEPFHNPLIYKILSSCTQVTTFTQFEKKELAKHGVATEKITVIPATYVPDADFTLGDGKKFRSAHKLTDEPLVLFLGTKAFDKGASHLLQAWPAVKKAVPNAVLVFAGLPTTAWEQELKQQSAEGIINLDYIGGEAKHDLLAAATVLCVPSRTESFGIVIPESWAKNKPVVVGPTGAAKELITEGKDGYTVGFGDTMTLSKRLIEILGDPKKAAAMGKAGRIQAKQFSREVYIKQLLAVYQKALPHEQA